MRVEAETGGHAWPPGGATVVAAFRGRAAAQGGAPAMHFRAGSRWAAITWEQLSQAVRRLAALLLDEGCAPHDAVGVCLHGRPEWVIADLAVLAGGMTSVVSAPWDAEPAVRMLAETGAVGAIVEGHAVQAAVRAARPRLPCLRRVVVVDGDAPDPDVEVTWQQAMERGEEALARRSAAFEARAAAVSAGDPATRVDRGGASPVVLTHADLAAVGESVASALVIEPVPSDGAPGERLLGCLPPSDLAERALVELVPCLRGGAVWFAADGDSLHRDLAAARPTVMVSPPAVWDALAARVEGGVRSASPPQRALAAWALAAGRRAARARAAGRLPAARHRAAHGIAERVLLGRLRAALGLDAARLLGCRGGPLEPGTAGVLAALGLDVRDLGAWDVDDLLQRAGREVDAGGGSSLP